MTVSKRWRRARFARPEQCAEFLERARALELCGLELEGLNELTVRFCVPPQYEIGMAGMVEAHGGRIMPTPDEVAV